MKKAATIFVAAALAAFGVAACGSDDSSDETTTAADTGTATAPVAGATTIAVSAPADGSFAYEPNALDAAAGTATIEFDNPATLSHDLILESTDGAEIGKTELIAQDTASFTATLKPGTYTFFCDVPGHQEGGMQGTLTVK